MLHAPYLGRSNRGEAIVPTSRLSPLLTCSCINSGEGRRTLTSFALVGDFENEVELDRHSEWKTGHPDHRSDRHLLTSKNVPEQVGGAIGDTWLVKKISVGRHEYAKPYDTRYPIE